eukprot:scaffold238590_cov30-Tisochrysis_lutea.AAC.3
MIASSSADHFERPSAAFDATTSSTCGEANLSGAGVQFLSMPHEERRVSSARRPSMFSPSPCRRCSRCHRLRTPSGVRPGS